MSKVKEQARLEQDYIKRIRPALQEKLGIPNIMEVPRIQKIVLNIGVKEAVADSKILQNVVNVLEKIAGQKCIRTYAKKSIATFKLREGMPIGVKVTLRKRRMYEFLDTLINLALPNYRDFQGVPLKFDGQGNYNLGIKEWIIFPEVDYDVASKMFGLNVTIQTNTKKDERALALLKEFGMPFKSA